RQLRQRRRAQMNIPDLMWIADEHRDNGKRFVVHADEKLTAFLELESPTTVDRGRTSVRQWSRLGNHSWYCRSIPASSGVQSHLKTSRINRAGRVSNPAEPKCHAERFPSVLNTRIGRMSLLLYLPRTSRSCAHR